MIRLVAYLLGVAGMGMIAQGVVGSALHNAVWATEQRTHAGETRIVTETTPGLTVTKTNSTVPVEKKVTRARNPDETVVSPATTTILTVPATTTMVLGPVVTTTVSGTTETVSTAGPAMTTTVRGPTTTTTVPGPTRTTTVPGPVVTTTVTGPTETVTETGSEACKPPPKKPSNPPCPPHK